MKKTSIDPKVDQAATRSAVWSVCLAMVMALISGMSIAAVTLINEMSQQMGKVVSVLFVVPIPLGLAALVMGILALRRGKGIRFRGRWMAVVGIVVGLLGFAFFTFYLVFTLALLHALSGG